jgi:hypothetical protein
MATLQQYVTQMRDRQLVIARKLGCNVTRIRKPERVLNLASLVILAAVVKALTDKGVMSDAELLAALNSARDDDWDDEPGDASGA